MRNIQIWKKSNFHKDNLCNSIVFFPISKVNFFLPKCNNKLHFSNITFYMVNESLPCILTNTKIIACRQCVRKCPKT